MLVIPAHAGIQRLCSCFCLFGLSFFMIFLRCCPFHRLWILAFARMTIKNKMRTGTGACPYNPSGSPRLLSFHVSGGHAGGEHICSTLRNPVIPHFILKDFHSMTCFYRALLDKIARIPLFSSNHPIQNGEYRHGISHRGLIAGDF